MTLNMAEEAETVEPVLLLNIDEREEIVSEIQECEDDTQDSASNGGEPSDYHHDTGEKLITSPRPSYGESARYVASTVDIETTSDSTPSPTPERDHKSEQAKVRPIRTRKKKETRYKTDRIKEGSVSKRRSKRKKTTTSPVVKIKVARKVRQSAQAKLQKEKTRKANLYLRKGLDNPTSAPNIANIPENERLKCGLEELESGKYKTVSAAAAYWRVHAGKLYRRFRGEIPVDAQHGPAPVLTGEEEQDLANWILTMNERGFQISPALVRDAVQSFFKRDNSPFINGRPSYRWYYSFLRRNPKLQQMKISNMALLCDANPSKAVIDEWFRELKSFLLKLGVLDKPGQIFSYAETKFEFDKKTDEIVAFSETHSGKLRPFQQRGATVSVCASADGQLCTPFIIYRGMSQKTQQWDPLDGATKGSGAFILEKDGKKQDAFSSWMEWHFLKHIGEARPVVVLLSCHQNEICYETYVTARQNDVFLFRIPSKASSLIQPLDIGENSPFKSAWLTEWMVENPHIPVRTNNVARVISCAWKEAEDSEAIQTCFIQSGIYPLDREMVDDDHLPDGNLDFLNKDPPKGGDSLPVEIQQNDHPASAPSPNVAEVVFQKLDEKLDKTTRETYRTCIENGLDLEETPLFSVWKKLYKEAYHNDSDTSPSTSKSGKGKRSKRHGKKQSTRGKRTSKRSKDEVYCPVCEEQFREDGEDWIGCDGQCQAWYHVNCLPPEVVTPALLEDKEMVCPKCLNP